MRSRKIRNRPVSIPDFPDAFPENREQTGLNPGIPGCVPGKSGTEISQSGFPDFPLLMGLYLLYSIKICHNKYYVFVLFNILISN